MLNGVAKIIGTIGALLGTVAGIGIDFCTDTHVFNDDWPPHARYHGAMFVFASIGVSLVCLWLIWGPRAGSSKDRIHRLRTVTALLLGQYLPFFVALLVPGASAATTGTPMPLGIPANVLTAIVVGALMPAMYWLEARSVRAAA